MNEDVAYACNTESGCNFAEFLWKKSPCQPCGTKKVGGNFQRERLSQPKILKVQNEARVNFLKERLGQY